ncbi:hypothetical protein ACELLULO517_04895 [Acidisoma cellulosilytica]|uniref:Tyrosine-protein kinase G-rich domain-containing protein n=1 Tax=Acidisoma cellulosilyticum TaxID=2802395 RepID=A0A963YYM1_9PROT|nr:exopolysaccharide transport family protein [Acidisoma cellulosilyticum]MCB8879561.1 hypothetical protein [Acidisoma cellulosilyticum]
MLDDADGRLYLGRGWGETAQTGAASAAGKDAHGAMLDRVLGVIGRQLWAILLPLVLIPGITGIALSRMPVLYTASGKVLYDPAGYTPDVLQSIVKSDPTTDTVVASQAAILASGTIAHRMAQALDLGRRSGFRPSPTVPLAEQPHAVDAAVLKAISVSPVDASRVFSVSFTARDPTVAASAVNLILDLYLADQLAAKTGALNAADAWMQARAAALNAKLLTEEAALARYRAANGLTQGVQARIGTEQMSALGAELMRAENDLAGADAKQTASGGRAAGVAQNVVAMRLAQAQVQAQLDAARTRLGPNHPQVRALREQLATLQAATGSEMAAVHADVAGDADAASARLASLRQSLLLLKAEGVAEAQAEGPLAAMEQEADATRKLRQTLLAQMDRTAQQAAIQTPDARILSRAEPPLTPSSPKVMLLMAAGVLAGLATGLGLAWLREAGQLTFRTEAEVQAALALPVIGSLPLIKGRARRDVARALVADGGLAARQLDSLRARLRLTLGDPRVIAVTSSRPGEGKSTFALAFARRAAMGGERVLLIDGDRARPNLSRMVLAGSRDGGGDRTAGALSRDALSGCAILPMGDHGDTTPTALRGVLARESGRRDFDLIILDAPPVQASADALALADLAEAVLFCLQWRRTPQRLAAHARRLLALPNARPIAAVLTQLDPNARAIRGFPEAEIGARAYAAYIRR